MTNHSVPDHGVALGHELLALAPLGARRRPVKIVEHPAFRVARARIGFDAPFTVLRLPVVSLDRGPARSTAGCSTSPGILGAA